MARKWALHGVSSDHVLQMPMTGCPSNRWSGNPWFFIQLRWMNPPLSVRPNHSALRSFRFDDISILLKVKLIFSVLGIRYWVLGIVQQGGGVLRFPPCKTIPNTQ